MGDANANAERDRRATAERVVPRALLLVAFAAATFLAGRLWSLREVREAPRTPRMRTELAAIGVGGAGTGGSLPEAGSWLSVRTHQFGVPERLPGSSGSVIRCSSPTTVCVCSSVVWPLADRVAPRARPASVALFLRNPLRPADLEVLRILWARGPQTIRTIYNAIAAQRPADYLAVARTVTYLARQGLLERSAEEQWLGGNYRYVATISERECANACVHLS